MKTERSRELDPTFETLGLISACYTPDYLDREPLLNATRETYNVDASALYKKFSGTLRRYVETFRKHWVPQPEAEFFLSDPEGSFVTLLLPCLLAHGDWVDAPEGVTDEAVVVGILDGVLEGGFSGPAPGLPEIIQLLGGQELEPDVCWRLTVLLGEPRVHMNALLEAVRQNREAFRQAVAAVEKPLARLTEAYLKADVRALIDVNMDLRIAPSLIAPVAIIADNRGNCRMGLYAEDFFRLINAQQAAGAELPGVLRALSDSSKFEILRALRQTPRYNLELAEKMGLTAATVSHHMGVLLAYHLVSVEKHDGRVYYTLNREALERVVRELEQSLLG